MGNHSSLLAEVLGGSVGLVVGLVVASLLETLLWVVYDHSNVSWLGSFLDFNPILLGAAGLIIGVNVGEKLHRHHH